MTEESAAVAVSRAPPAYLVAHVEKLLPFVRDPWRRRKLFLRAAEDDEAVVERLRGLDAVSFVYCKTKLGQAVDSGYIKDVYDACEDSSDRGLLVWCMGKLGHWELLLHVHEDHDRYWMARYLAMAADHDSRRPLGA